MSHVIAGCLHRDQRDAMTAQVSGEGQQRTRGCPVLPDLLAPPPGLVCVRNPHAGRQGCLAQVQRSHALGQFRQIACLLHQEPPLPCSRNGTAARGSSREDKSRTHVLEATLRGPWRNSRRQTVKRPPPRAKTVRRRRATTPIFTPAGRPRQGTFLTVKPLLACAANSAAQTLDGSGQWRIVAAIPTRAATIWTAAEQCLRPVDGPGGGVPSR